MFALTLQIILTCCAKRARVSGRAETKVTGSINTLAGKPATEPHPSLKALAPGRDF